ncbi:MAG: hypothetical protein FWF86_05455 [Clostridia bacterium]|nr:hypothetical protein [Clostridia bacterium]
MAKYTVEDIEILRQKSGITYEEAINLLEYHNGSLARALVDLEKNGRLRDVKPGHGDLWKKRRKGGLLNYLYRMRLKVTKGDLTIINVSSLFVIFTAISAFWVLAIGAVVAMVLGYRISMERNSPDFQEESLENLIRNASSNMKNSAFSFVQDLGMMDNNQEQAPTEEEAPRAEAAPSGTTPVTVQFPDGGSVDVKEGEDGFHEADVQ